MRYALAILAILFLVLLAFGGETTTPNLQQPRFNIYTAGQPTDEGFKEIADMGVKTVINVLPEKECLPEEPGIVEKYHMAYAQVPFETSGFKMDTIREFGKLLDMKEKPILIHCSTGNHVGGMWFAYRVLIEKAALGPALKEARRIGLKPELEDSLFNWVLNQQQQIASK